MADEEKLSMEDRMSAVWDDIQTRNKADAPEPEPAAAPEPTPTDPDSEAAAGTAGEASASPADASRDPKTGQFTKPPKNAAKAAAGGQRGAQGRGGATTLAGKGQSAPTGQKSGKETPSTEAAPTQAAPVDGKQTPDQTTSTGLAGVNPPAGWSAAAKAQWASIPPAVQAAVAKREQEVSQGFSQYEGLGRALAPMQQTLQMRGVQPAAYVNQMVQLDMALSNPATRAQAFDYLARSYGYQFPNSAQPQQGASNPAAPLSQDPNIAALQQQIALLSQGFQGINARQQADAQAAQAEVQQSVNADIQKFRDDPANEFFDLVQPQMSAIFEQAALRNQPTPTLKEVYEQAIWSHPQTRPVLLAREQQKQVDTQAKAAAKAAAEARKSAAPNVRGSAGVSAPSRGPRKSLEDEMAETYDKIHAA